MDAKQYLSEILGYYKYKVDNNLCGMAEMQDALQALESNMDIHGTISDFAKFYDIPENQVRATIARKLIAKPKRKLLYPFHKFVKIVPDSWRKKKEG